MRARERGVRGGAVLLEVLVAIVVLATAGAAIAGLAVESNRAVQHAQSTEAELRHAEAFFGMVAIWPREDLNRHLGERVQGPWRLRVERYTATLYTITLSDSLSARTLLRTALYRLEPPHDTP